VAGACLFLYMLVLNRHARVQSGKMKGRSFAETFLVGILLMTLGLIGAREIAGWDGPLRNPQEDLFRNQTGELPTPPTAVGRENEFAWLPVLLTVGLVLLAVGGWWYADRARRKSRGELRWGFADAVVEAVDDSIDDLRAEPDPRRAVIAAYARLERVFAANGVSRKPSEAPLEYLARVLASLQVGDRAAARLTDLFERAKFSQHAVGPEMKEEAIEAFVSVRDELLVARALAEQARREAHEARQTLEALR
jgi:hypothetical protein